MSGFGIPMDRFQEEKRVSGVRFQSTEDRWQRTDDRKQRTDDPLPSSPIKF
jgi:hypothetical protein